MTVKFMWNGIKVDGKLYKAHYNKGSYRSLPDGTITIYGGWGYPGLPEIKGLNVENNSDAMTDYFESDKIRVTPSNIYYKEVNEAVQKQQEHTEKKIAKRYGKGA